MEHGTRARSRMLRMGWGAALLWTLMSGLLFGWQARELRSSAIQHALADARAHIQKDLALRLWASKKGGIYVSPDAETPPNPYLSHLPHRDVQTTGGQQLTLMNPNYLVRQVMQAFTDLYGIRGRIVGSKALNPDNLADAWEQEQLASFTQEQQLAHQLHDDFEIPYLRVIQPIMMRDSCMACHGQLGYQPGDVRGGISVMIPMTSYFSAQYKQGLQQGAIYGFFWLLGLLAIGLYSRSALRVAAEREGYIGQLQQLNLKLEDRVADRTRELEAAQRTAHQANRAKSEFLASMSHELRTPLNAILGFSQLLASDEHLHLPENSREELQEISAAGDHLLALVNDLIDLSRIEAGQIDYSLEAIQLQPVLRECLALVSPLAQKRGIQLAEGECLCCSEGVAVLADYVRLRQVVINYLSNAIKYNRPGGHVSLYCKLHAEQVRIVVSDTGHGIPVNMQDRIFNRVDRLGEERGSVEGTGIGLVLTKRMVEGMRGQVGFASTPGEGSSFWVELPRCEMPQPEASPGQPETSPGGTVVMPVPGKLLLVEDNPVNQRLALALLRKAGYEADVVADGEAAVEAVAQHPYALVLMDCHMPKMDGYEATEKIRQHELANGLPRRPIIAMTANALEGDRERCLAVGMDDYLAKPIDFKRLTALLAEWSRPQDTE